MADELQGLLKRIQQEGLEQAEATKEQTLLAAQAEADAILSKAKTEAEHLVAAARQEALLLSEKGEQSLKQAARDVLLSLREQLETRVANVARTMAAAHCDADTVAGIIASLATTYLQAERDGSLEIQLPAGQQEALQAALGKSLGEDLAKRCELAPVPTINAGFKLVISDQDVVYDFTDASLGETMAAFLSPRLATLVLGVVAEEN